MARKSAANKHEAGSVQFTVLLPFDMHKRLQTIAGERGLGEEIRRRLEASFEAEKTLGDPETRELLDAISNFASQTTMYYGEWSKDPFAFKVLKTSVDMLLSYYEPKGDPVPNPNIENLADDLFGPNHLAEDVSQTFLRIWKQDRAKRVFADRQEG
jgi:hypothetical protein